VLDSDISARVDAMVTIAEIDVDDAPPIRERAPPQRLPLHDAGIGDEPVEPAEFFHDGFDGARGRGFFGDIALDQQHVAGSPGKRSHARLGQIERTDPPARRQQMARDRPANAAGRAGDQRDRRRRLGHG
jgi:hypothetical protein